MSSPILALKYPFFFVIVETGGKSKNIFFFFYLTKSCHFCRSNLANVPLIILLLSNAEGFEATPPLPQVSLLAGVQCVHPTSESCPRRRVSGFLLFPSPRRLTDQVMVGCYTHVIPRHWRSTEEAWCPQTVHTTESAQDALEAWEGSHPLIAHVFAVRGP